MKKPIYLILALCLFSLNSIAETKYVSAKSLNVRSGAGSENPVVSKLTQNQKVNVISEKDGWSQIENGWVASKFLSFNNPLPQNNIKNTILEKKQTTKNETQKFIAKMLSFQGTIGRRSYEWTYRDNSCISKLVRSKRSNDSDNERKNEIYASELKVIIDWSKIIKVYIKSDSGWSSDEEIYLEGDLEKSGYYYERNDYNRMVKKEYNPDIMSNEFSIITSQNERILKAMEYLWSICKDNDPF